MLIVAKNLERLRLITIGLLVLILWLWELLEHFLLLPTRAILLIEMIPLTLLLVVLLYLLFGAIIRGYQRLQESNRHLGWLQNYQASILDSSPNAIVAVGQDGLVSSFNRQAELLTAYSVEEAVGTDVLTLFNDASKVRLALQRVPSHNYVETIEEAALITKVGVQIPVSMLLRRIDARDENGQGVVLILEDLREKRRLERQLVISEKMAAVSQLAAGLAHEIKNPLASIGVNTRNLEDQIKEGAGRCEECEKYSTMIAAESVRVNHLVDNFLRSIVPRKIALTTCSYPLDEIMNLAVERCQLFLKEKSIQVVKNFQSPAVCVECDREQLIQAFSNLTQNAVEAISSVGELSIEIRQDGNWSLVKVCDTGCGIPREDLAQVFDFYFTNKVHGLGIGLPFAAWVIEQHGGRIEIESEENKGTCVRVWLPRKRGDSYAKRSENHP